MEDDIENSIAITSKGTYAEIVVTRDDQFWRMIVDEKNLAKFIYSAQQVLQEIKGEKRINS